MDYSPSGSSVHEILQERILEWVANFYFRRSYELGIEHTSFVSPALAGRFFTTRATWEALNYWVIPWNSRGHHFKYHLWLKTKEDLELREQIDYTYGEQCHKICGLQSRRFNSGTKDRSQSLRAWCAEFYLKWQDKESFWHRHQKWVERVPASLV